MAAIDGQSLDSVTLLLNKDYVYPPDSTLIKQQMSAIDKFGNSPLHKAFRYRKLDIIKKMFEYQIGDLRQRNVLGKTPLEIPHNDPLVDVELKDMVRQELGPIEKEDGISLEKEPDYIFECPLSRVAIIEDQLDAIN